MLSFNDITAAVREILERASPKYLSIEDVLERLPMRDALIAQLQRHGDVVGAHQAAMSMVRDALNHVGAEVQFQFGKGRVPVKEETPDVLHVVYRLVEANR